MISTQTKTWRSLFVIIFDSISSKLFLFAWLWWFNKNKLISLKNHVNSFSGLPRLQKPFKPYLFLSSIKRCLQIFFRLSCKTIQGKITLPKNVITDHQRRKHLLESRLDFYSTKIYKQDLEHFFCLFFFLFSKNRSKISYIEGYWNWFSETMRSLFDLIEKQKRIKT